MEKGPGGLKALKFVSYGDKYNSLLNYFHKIPNMAADAGRFVMNFYIDKNYEPYTTGRLAGGIHIADPASTKANCLGGGCLPENQKGSSVRLQYVYSRANGTLSPNTYAYHLNRTTQRITSTPKLIGQKATTVMWGQGKTGKIPFPKGEWVTMVLDVKLNDINTINGSTNLMIFNNQGKLVESILHENMEFRRTANWKILGPYFTEKFNNYNPGPKTQAMYTNGYAIYARTPGCK